MPIARLSKATSDVILYALNVPAGVVIDSYPSTFRLVMAMLIVIITLLPFAMSTSI